jgi:GH24 family phage-related lysozyme (muramidase)
MKAPNQETEKKQFFQYKWEEKDLFDEAVECIKKHEGWHTSKNHPYVGYGHKLRHGEKFGSNITEEFADSLLRKDLLQKCKMFRGFGRDSLLLGVLAYNVGEYTLLGSTQKKKSRLIKKLENGDRNIHDEYISFRKYKGKVIPSIERRRKHEYKLLLNQVKYVIIREYGTSK